MSASDDPATGGSEEAPAAFVPVRRIGRRRVEWRPAREAGDGAEATGATGATGAAIDEAAAGRLSGTGPDDGGPHHGAAGEESPSDGAARDAWLNAQRPPHWE